MSIREGDKVDAFSLPYQPGETVDLGDHLGTDKIVLLFFPLAFSSVCTTEMCTMRDDWSKWESLGAKVFGITCDSPFVTAKFRDELNVPFPIMSDFNRDISKKFDAVHADLKGMRDVPKRAAFVIDTSGTCTMAWVSENPGVEPNYDEIKNAVVAAG